MELIFLGTGPAGGILSSGKPRRWESSALLKTSQTRILIDVTNDFLKQAKQIQKIDAVLITHAHRDACGGIRFISGGIPLFTHPQTAAKIKKRLPRLKLNFQVITTQRSFKINDVSVTPFLVSHSIQPGFPTLGFHFEQGGKKLVYVSDTGGWGKEADSLMKSADVLVLDGAMWGRRIKSHLDIKEILPRICQWSVKRIIFTQIGKTAPQYEVLEKEIKKIYTKALPAFDGMRIKIGV